LDGRDDQGPAGSRARELIALKYGAAINNRLIAQLTGLSESNVGIILHRVVQTLRSRFQRHAPPEYLHKNGADNEYDHRSQERPCSLRAAAQAQRFLALYALAMRSCSGYARWL
jgi:hypothetical protein